MEDKLRHICDAIIDTVCEKGSCDFVADIASAAPIIVIGNMLGVAPTDNDDLLRWSDDMLKALGSPDASLMDNAATAFVEYTGYINPVFEDRRARGTTDDLVSVLCHAVDGDSLDNDSLVHETLLILIGGDETTPHDISGGFEHLLAHPDQVPRLAPHTNADQMQSAIEEMLRWVSPIKNMARTATRDVELDGATIAKGQELILLYPSANRDADVFEHPDRFDIARTPNPHMAFGFGAHFCLGNQLARLELKVMTERLLARTLISTSPSTAAPLPRH